MRIGSRRAPDSPKAAKGRADRADEHAFVGGTLNHETANQHAVAGAHACAGREIDRAAVAIELVELGEPNAGLVGGRRDLNGIGTRRR